jgi:prolipoprotein diacylglyceryltransferase
VGALLGGWFAVELVKRQAGIRARTGDLFAVPLCAGIALGRVGCFLAGPADRTHGVETALPWGVDHGDGVARHPVALIEALLVLALGLLLDRLERRPHAQGALFRLFLASYLALRVALDALKPVPRYFGLGTLQWACLAALFVLAVGQLYARRAEVRPA